VSTKVAENGWYTRDHIISMGFRSLGKNVLISDKCSIYGAQNIDIGDDVRIDDFCILTSVKGSIVLEGNNHIGALTYINGNGNVVLKKFSGLSSRCAVYSETDDFTGGFMTGSTIPMKYKNVETKNVSIGRHVVVGTGSTILPGVTLANYSSVGCNSVIRKDTKEGVFYYGNPAIGLKKRDTCGIAEMEKKYLQETKDV
tara:strand:- start:111 stop:707 length:597 start_codon:yes stop_codon:yes gene_type:complete